MKPGRKPFWTARRLELLAQFRRAGASMDRCARAFGRSRKAVEMAVYRYGLAGECRA